MSWRNQLLATLCPPPKGSAPTLPPPELWNSCPLSVKQQLSRSSYGHCSERNLPQYITEHVVGPREPQPTNRDPLSLLNHGVYGNNPPICIVMTITCCKRPGPLQLIALQ
ncbi:hypothetical protein SRHO_G00329690 [Serrasalmus rhombeus]